MLSGDVDRRGRDEHGDERSDEPNDKGNKGAGGGRAKRGERARGTYVARHATPTPPRAAVTSNYMRQMATDLDGLADESPEIRRLLNSAPNMLDSRRLWRARQTIGLEPHAELRFELVGGAGCAQLLSHLSNGAHGHLMRQGRQRARAWQ